jgi:hypothetical protein
LRSEGSLALQRPKALKGLSISINGAPDSLRLTRRANQGHINIIADIVAPAPGNRQRAFHWRRRNPQRQFQIVEPVSLDFRSFVYRPISSDCGNYRFRTSRPCFDISRKCSDNPKKGFDTSGKSGAYQHHRKN